MAATMTDVQVVPENTSDMLQSQTVSTEDTSADTDTEDTSSGDTAAKTTDQKLDSTNSKSSLDSSSSSQSDSDVSSPPKKTLFSNIPDLNTSDWYMHKCFDRYWNHYRYVNNWYKKHCHVYRSLQRKLTSNMTPPQTTYQYHHSNLHPYLPHSRFPPSYPTQHSMTSIKPKSNRAKKRQSSSKSQFPSKRSAPTKRQQLDVMEVESGGVDGNEDAMSCDTTDMSEAPELVTIAQMDMDISDEMLDFFAKTQKHRKEREAEKQAEKQKQKEEKRLNIEEVTGPQKERTSEAPKERPGSRRTAEMKLLYGKGAAMIHGMETALQMAYDRNFDANQPRYWPNMPFRIVFADT